MTYLLQHARRYPVWLCFVLVFALTWPIDLAMAAQSHGRLSVHVPEWVGFLVGYGFVAAAVLASAIAGGWAEVRGLLRRFLIWRVGIVWYGVVLLAPAILILVALALDMLLGGPAPEFAQPFVRKLIPEGPSLWVVAPLWLLFEMLTNGEEIAWRGYALPRLLARHSALVASLILGPVWAIWHVPKFLLAGTVGSAHAYPFWVFALNILTFTLLLTWVFVHTQGSLLLATLFHAASNTAWMCLPAVPGSRAFFIAMALQAVFALVVVWVSGPALARRPNATVLRPMAPHSIPVEES